MQEAQSSSSSSFALELEDKKQEDRVTERSMAAQGAGASASPLSGFHVALLLLLTILASILASNLSLSLLPSVCA
jgi:hypothetical protein